MSDALGSSSPLTYPRFSSSPRLVDSITPPSSPPPARQYAIKQRQVDAFSVLGKRKTPLSDTDNNVRPQKKTAWSISRKDSTGKIQMHLSLGQVVEKRCKECDMVYITSSSEDRALHDQFHRRLFNGHDVGVQFVARTSIVKVNTEDSICKITHKDPPWRRKHARSVLDIITKSLGACDIPDTELWRSCKDTGGVFEMYMYVRGSTCLAAVLIETPVSKARRILSVSPTLEPGLSAVERLRRRRETAKVDSDQPLRISDQTYPAPIGISRIWTAPTARKQGFAITLLDAMYKQWLSTENKSGGKLEDIAFSQPTTAGTRLARRWFGKQSGWLVYS